MRGSKFSWLTARTRSGTVKVGLAAVLALAACAPAAAAHSQRHSGHSQHAPMAHPLGHKVG